MQIAWVMSSWYGNYVGGTRGMMVPAGPPHLLWQHNVLLPGAVAQEPRPGRSRYPLSHTEALSTRSVLRDDAHSCKALIIFSPQHFDNSLNKV